MTMLIRKATWVKGQGVVSSAAAKKQALDKLRIARIRRPKQYSRTAVFEIELIEMLPLSARDGLLEDHQEELENVADTESFEEQRPLKSG